ncbi:hypothetical protein QE429_000754 [Bacillus sp. SORGH_AS 510]|uniref:hypothetical protein n=1 Tax=Bacillus sp. SORGH_AS_0510 TaxID=3041771 RepID=UPI002780F9A6|nr:hypothetical protein [Bacillus sp. SORGH_AS_0510]MDQ1143927.1 hypothetical protein [Bacillus sp. SORGH_AS_0510]
MALLVFIIGLGLIGMLLAVKNNLMKNVSFHEVQEKKRLDRILRFVRIAPFLAVIVIGIITITYLKTKYDIRLSHAWLTVQFWMFSAIYYYFFMLTKRKSKLSMIGLVFSFAVAIYLTPIGHYETVISHMNLWIPNIFALFMLFISHFNSRVFLKHKA